MKNSLIKSIAGIVLIAMVLSSCSVTYRERHAHRPPPPKEKVIIVH